MSQGIPAEGHGRLAATTNPNAHSTPCGQSSPFTLKKSIERRVPPALLEVLIPSQSALKLQPQLSKAEIYDGQGRLSGPYPCCRTNPIGPLRTFLKACSRSSASTKSSMTAITWSGL